MTAARIVAQDLTIRTEGGRALILNLELHLGRERVAVVGRNGVGKSALFETLAGVREASDGEIVRTGSLAYVPQNLDRQGWTSGSESVPEDERELERSRGSLSRTGSRGERRKRALAEAKSSSPDILLLDEPTCDLDAVGTEWLVDWVRDFPGCLLVASHDPRLLGEFDLFVRIAERGCLSFEGDFDELIAQAEDDGRASELRYLRNLNRLAAEERKSERDRRRRLRKKNGGRARELDRAPSRAKLNLKRSYAQESQGKREKKRRARIESLRTWTKATRRALEVRLPLETPVAEIGVDSGEPAVVLTGVSSAPYGRTVFSDLSLSVGRERVLVTGSNGAGKSTLLRTIAGDLEPSKGGADVDTSRLGVVMQSGENWMLADTLLTKLRDISKDLSPEEIASQIVSHRFPLALAERPLATLSPGERIRAALIVIFARAPAIDVLILDEPIQSLDFAAAVSFRNLIDRWRGGLVVATHDAGLANTFRTDRVIELDSEVSRSF